MATTPSFQEIICLVVGLACISTLTNCADDEIAIEVADPLAKSKNFIQVQDYTLMDEYPGMTRKKRNIILGSENHWTGGIVPYTILSELSESEKLVILQSMKHWEVYTCIRFRPRTNNDTHSITFLSGDGCASFIGRINRPSQGIILGYGCINLPTIIHLIGHSLGFFHEHSRNDRDSYVRVIENSTLQGDKNALYSRVTSDTATTLDFGYDYASIMHYSSASLTASDPNIPIGGAQELSPLDAAKANQLYNCSTYPLRPPSIVIPEITVPNEIFCGEVIEVTGPGSITSPQYPRHLFNEECAFVLQATEGYGLIINFPEFSLDSTINCTEDYVQFYRGASIYSRNLIKFYRGNSEGRICNREEEKSLFSFYTRVVTVYYVTNNRNIRSDVTGLRTSYDIRDIDECQTYHRCHSCENLPGSFVCNCREGYYLSYAARTCFDVNECAFGNGDCEDTCNNFGGSYNCTCNNGLFLQADGLSCGRTAPSSAPQPPTPGTIIPRPSNPTPEATILPPPPICGGQLTNSSGTFNTPNWPLTYPFDINCTWNIVLNNSNAVIEISFDDDFGIEGEMPNCPNDQLLLFDGGSAQSQKLGVFCDLTRPDPITTTSNRLTVTFVSMASHEPTRHGFRAQYRSIDEITSATTSPPGTTSAPTTVPLSTTSSAPTTASPSAITPTPTLQLPQCGGGLRKLTSQNSSLQTLGWPNSPYPINTECDWDIKCLIGSTIAIQFEDSFRVAGLKPNCTKDKLIISGCEGMTYGPYCYLTAPEPFMTTCNAVHVSFQAGSERGDSRTGFKLNYRCNATTAPTPTQSPLCAQDKPLTAANGSIQTLNWPNDPYPTNLECLWEISCSSFSRVQIFFEPNFRVAGTPPECDKDQLEILGCGTYYGPFCYLTPPDPITTTCNKVSVQFRSGANRGITRTGFKLNYRCL